MGREAWTVKEHTHAQEPVAAALSQEKSKTKVTSSGLEATASEARIQFFTAKTLMHMGTWG